MLLTEDESWSMSARIWEKVAGPEVTDAVVLPQDATRRSRTISNNAIPVRKYLFLISTKPSLLEQYCTTNLDFLSSAEFRECLFRTRS